MDISSTSPPPLALNHRHAPISFLLRFHSLTSSLFPSIIDHPCQTESLVKSACSLIDWNHRQKPSDPHRYNLTLMGGIGLLTVPCLI